MQNKLIIFRPNASKPNSDNERHLRSSNLARLQEPVSLGRKRIWKISCGYIKDENKTRTILFLSKLERTYPFAEVTKKLDDIQLQHGGF